MELAFQTRELRKLCEDDVMARAKLPEPTVNDLQMRLADLHAATVVLDLMVLGPTLSTDPPGTIAFELAGGWELVCQGNHPRPQLASVAPADFTRIRRVKVIRVAEVDVDE